MRARGSSAKGYYIASLRAGDVRNRGINLAPRPEPDNLGHTELPEINAGNRKESTTLERQEALAQLCLHVEGPFHAQ